MIVTCEECSTSFQLDEERIPASGAQVRCSRCKHVFFLAHPSVSRSQATHSIAEEAAHDPVSSVPPVVSDAPKLASNADVAVPDAELDEEDWEFSEEIRNEGDDDLEPEGDFGVSEDFASDLEADDLLGEDTASALDPAGSSAAIESVNLDSSTSSGLELESGPEPMEPVRDESNFGSVDDFSSLMEDEVGVDPSDTDAEIESAFSTVESGAESTSVYSESGPTDDLGDPESWDLIGNHDLAATKSLSGSTDGSLQGGAFAPGIATEDESEESPSLYEEEIGPMSPRWQHLAHLGRGIGWAVTIAFTVGALGLGLRSEWTRSAQSPQTVSLGALTAQTTRASWVETSRSGLVLVVSGQIRNTGSIPLPPRTVQLGFLDVAGQRLAGTPIQVGERLAESVLREAPRDQLIASAAAAALRLRGTVLEPGESRAFEAIVLEDYLPAGARRILLEIGDSAVGLEPVRPVVQVEEESEFSP